MIRSCEDVKTTDDFQEFCNVLFNTYDMGLNETADTICWEDPNIISPKAFTNIYNKD